MMPSALSGIGGRITGDRWSSLGGRPTPPVAGDELVHPLGGMGDVDVDLGQAPRIRG